MRKPRMRSRSPAAGDSQVSILMILRLAGQLFELARLREIAVHQLEVLGLLQRLVAVRGLIAVGDDVARQRRQNVVRVGIGREGGHAGEGAQRTGDQCGALVGGRLGGRRRAQGYGFAARGAVGLEVGVSAAARSPASRSSMARRRATAPARAESPPLRRAASSLP